MSWWWDSSYENDETSQKILTTFISLIVLWFLLSAIFKKKKRPLPPGPCGLPLVGYIPFLDSNLCRAFAELRKTHGPIFKIRLGAKLCIVISSPSLVKEVVRDQDVTFANRDPTVAATVLSFGASDIAFSNYGHTWRNMRKIFASEMLSSSSLDTSYYLRKQQVKKAIASTYEKAGEVVDVGELAFSAIMNSMTSMVWGQTLKGSVGGAINAEFRAVMQDIVELVAKPNISDFFPVLSGFDLQQVRRKVRVLARRCEDIMDSAISHHENGHVDFLGCLLQLTKSEDPATSLTVAQVKGMLLDTVLGGMDTSITTIEWAMAELMKHPNIRRKVQEELTNVVGLNTSVEEAHLSELKYLKAVVKETLRLHPPLPLLLPHCSSKDTFVGGYIIPKGSQIFLNIGAIQTDPQLWEAPSEFQPERFMRDISNEEVEYWGKNLQFLPFGSGRRMCAGIPLAERMVMYGLGSLLHAFEWSLPDGVEEVDLSDKFGVIVKKATPLFAIPSPRLSNLELYSYSD